jgi:hypothetical protein
MGESALPPSGLVLSAGFSVADGTLADVKIDLCAHCLPRSPRAWLRLLEECRHDFDLAPIGVGNGLLDGCCEVAFVGFGLDGMAARRLNLYLKPAATVH